MEKFCFLSQPGCIYAGEPAFGGICGGTGECIPDYYAQFRRTSFDSHPPLRELNLSRENGDRFFAIVAGQTLEVENGLKGKRSLQVCSQNPRFYVQVQRQGRDGLSVSFDPKNFLFFGEKCLYVGDEERIYCCDEECSRVMGVFAAQMSQSVKHTVTVNQKDIPLLYERVSPAD